MKKILLLTLLMTIALTTKAQQWYVGPQASLNLCSITNVPSSKTYAGFALGAFGGYEIDRTIGIEGQLTVSTQGVKCSYSSELIPGTYEANIKNTYINFPIMAKFNIYKGIFALAGEQTGLRVGSKLIIDGQKISKGNDYTAMDFGLIFGAGYQFDFGLRACISYNLGLTKVAINEGGQNRVFAITAGWRF